VQLGARFTKWRAVIEVNDTERNFKALIGHRMELRGVRECVCRVSTRVSAAPTLVR
jgi:hypothetical protein